MLFITGGSGFIGSHFIRDYLQSEQGKILNLDKLSYAAQPENLVALHDNPNYLFAQICVGQKDKISHLLATHGPNAILHFAAETHVDRSLACADPFIENNIVAGFNFLEACRDYWQNLPLPEKNFFRFIQISTDEVYGPAKNFSFVEGQAYAPSNPYAASKAAFDHLAWSAWQSYQFPVIWTHACNNYGPGQFHEKFIPKVISCALAGKDIAIYGNGLQRRTWLFVNDHCHALRLILNFARPGQRYHIATCDEKKNLDVVRDICDFLDIQHPRTDGLSYRSQIRHVADRLGHDQAYALDTKNIQQNLAWFPRISFTEGLQQTIAWYLAKYTQSA